MFGVFEIKKKKRGGGEGGGGGGGARGAKKQQPNKQFKPMQTRLLLIQLKCVKLIANNRVPTKQY